MIPHFCQWHAFRHSDVFLTIFGQVMSLPFASSVNLLSDLVHSCNDDVANYIRMLAIYCPKVEWR